MNVLAWNVLQKEQHNKTCCICDEGGKAFAWHVGGKEHMTCMDCVKTWTKETIDSPNCPVCKAKIDPRSILTEEETQAALRTKEIEQVVATAQQVSEDERFAQRLQGGEGGGGLAMGGADGAHDPDLAAAIAASLDPAQNRAPGLNGHDPDLAAAIAASLDPAQDVVQPVEARGRQADRSLSACSMMTGVAAIAAVAAMVIGFM